MDSQTGPIQSVEDLPPKDQLTETSRERCWVDMPSQKGRGVDPLRMKLDALIPSHLYLNARFQLLPVTRAITLTVVSGLHIPCRRQTFEDSQLCDWLL
jgi:hypothetical protein